MAQRPQDKLQLVAGTSRMDESAPKITSKRKRTRKAMNNDFEMIETPTFETFESFVEEKEEFVEPVQIEAEVEEVKVSAPIRHTQEIRPLPRRQSVPRRGTKSARTIRP